MGLWWSEVQILSPRLTKRGRKTHKKGLPASFYVSSRSFISVSRHNKLLCTYKYYVPWKSHVITGDDAIHSVQAAYRAERHIYVVGGSPLSRRLRASARCLGSCER